MSKEKGRSSVPTQLCHASIVLVGLWLLYIDFEQQNRWSLSYDVSIRPVADNAILQENLFNLPSLPSPETDTRCNEAWNYEANEDVTAAF